MRLGGNSQVRSIELHNVHQRVRSMHRLLRDGQERNALASLIIMDVGATSSDAIRSLVCTISDKYKKLKVFAIYDKASKFFRVESKSALQTSMDMDTFLSPFTWQFNAYTVSLHIIYLRDV